MIRWTKVERSDGMNVIFRNIHDFSADGRSLYKTRYYTPFRTLWSGRRHFRYPISTKDKEQGSSSQLKSLLSIFVGYAWKAESGNSGNPQSRRQFIFPCASGPIKFAKRWSESSYHQPELTPFELVEDISGCLLGEEDDGSDLAKDQKDAMEAKHDFWSISGSFIYRHLVVNCENYMCLEKNHLPFRWITLTLFDTLKRVNTKYKSTTSTINWMSMGNDHYMDLGLDSQVHNSEENSCVCWRKIDKDSEVWSNMYIKSQREQRQQW